MAALSHLRKIRAVSIFLSRRRTETAQISNPKGRGASIHVTTYFSGVPPTVKVSLPVLAETSLDP